MSPWPIAGGQVLDGQPQEVVAVIGALLPCVRLVCWRCQLSQPQEVVAVIGVLLPCVLVCWRCQLSQPQEVVAVIGALLPCVRSARRAG